MEASRFFYSKFDILYIELFELNLKNNLRFDSRSDEPDSSAVSAVSR